MSLCFSKSQYLELVVCIRAKKSNVDWLPLNTIFYIRQFIRQFLNWNVRKLFGKGCYVWRKRARNGNFNFHTEDRFTYTIRDESCGRGICYYETQTLQNTTRSQLVLKAVSQWWLDERAQLGIKAKLRFGIFKNAFGNLEYFPLNNEVCLYEVRTRKIVFHIEL